MEHIHGPMAGRTALVTGATSGIGRATALGLATMGAHIAITGRDRERTESAAREISAAEGVRVEVFVADLSSQGQVRRLASEVLERLPRIHVLVNNVGGSAPGGPVEMAEEAWDAQIDLNLKSIFLTCKHVIPVMEAQGGGSIINTASASGIRWTGAAQVAYAASKAGVIQFSKVVAVQYAPKNIRVNTIVPGQLHTPMVEVRLAKTRAGGDVEKLLAQRQARIPLGFMGDGRDTANAALYLASDESRWVTGTEIVLDGGMSARCD